MFLSYHNVFNVYIIALIVASDITAFIMELSTGDRQFIAHQFFIVGFVPLQSLYVLRHGYKGIW